MSPYRRVGGFSASPGVPGGGRDARLSLDEGFLTVWSGQPETVWQTPLDDVGGLEVEIGRRTVLRATVGGVRYAFAAPSGPELDDLVEQVRAAGGQVSRPRRAWRLVGLASALVVLLAAAAGFADILVGRGGTTTATPSVGDLYRVDVSRADLAGTWSATPNGLLTILIGTPREVVRPTTKQPKTSRLNKEIWSDVAGGFQSCMGLSAAKDRMFGAAGQQPALQVTGSTWGSSDFGGTEIASVTQYYASTSMVDRDRAEYERPAFARCWGLASARILLGYEDDTTAAARAQYPTTSFTATSFARGFRRAAVSTVHLPGIAGTYSLVTIFAAVGHEELNFYALTGDWAKARPTVMAAFEATLARADVVSTTPSAA